jgi:hypothetical protein
VAASGPVTRALLVAYPSRSGEAPPTVESVPSPDGGATLRITDPAGDRTVVAHQRADGSVTIEDTHTNGSTRVRYDDAAARFGGAGVRVVTPSAGPLGLRVGDGSVDVLAAGERRWLRVKQLPFTVRRADGACAIVRQPFGTYVKPGSDGAVTLHASPGNSVPAADAGRDRGDVAPGTTVALRGRGCDLDRDRLIPRWELVAAPPGSAWSLIGAGTWSPRLRVDAPGPYRVRLTVTDRRGATSRASDVEVFGGPRCVGDRLLWSDPAC